MSSEIFVMRFITSAWLRALASSLSSSSRLVSRSFIKTSASPTKLLAFGVVLKRTPHNVQVT